MRGAATRRMVEPKPDVKSAACATRVPICTEASRAPSAGRRSTGSLSSASRPKTHSCTSRSGAPRAIVRVPQCRGRTREAREIAWARARVHEGGRSCRARHSEPRLPPSQDRLGGQSPFARMSWPETTYRLGRSRSQLCAAPDQCVCPASPAISRSPREASAIGSQTVSDGTLRNIELSASTTRRVSSVRPSNERGCADG